MTAGAKNKQDIVLTFFNYINYEKHPWFLISQLRENTQKLFAVMSHSY